MSFHRLLASVALIGCIASATARTAAPLMVDSVDIEQVAALRAGVPLRFTAFGTPGAQATLRIDGARRLLALRETDAGIYEGVYVIDAGDSIRADSRVTATLQKDGGVATSSLDEPLLLARGTAPWGAPPAAANMLAAPAAPAPAAQVAQAAAATTAAPAAAPAAPGAFVPQHANRDPEPCPDCAFVESIRAVQGSAHEGPILALAGAVAGAVLGEEAGAAHHRRMVSLLGAVGGALVGHEIDLQRAQPTGYDVVLRLADGTRVTRRYEQPPAFAAGALIRLEPRAGGTGPGTF